MTDLTLKLIIIFMPGALGAIIIDRLTFHKNWTSFRFILNSIIVGLFSYLIYQMILFLWHLFTSDFLYVLAIWSTFPNMTKIPFGEVFFASLISIPVGFLASMMIHKRWINGIANYIGISNKYGDENLFSYFLQKNDRKWIYIREKSANLTYLGYVESYSETDNASEILLNEVTVQWTANSQELYRVEKLYLCLSKCDFSIERAITN